MIECERFGQYSIELIASSNFAFGLFDREIRRFRTFQNFVDVAQSSAPTQNTDSFVP